MKYLKQFFGYVFMKLIPIIIISWVLQMASFALIIDFTPLHLTLFLSVLGLWIATIFSIVLFDVFRILSESVFGNKRSIDVDLKMKVKKRDD